MTPSHLDRPRFAETLSRDGTCISYVTRGRGRPLVMLLDRHSASTAWMAVAQHWPANRQAVLPDPRGSGWSERPVHAGAYTLQRLADDVEAVLATTRQPIELLAWSAAAQVALALARRPVAKRVRRWVLISGFRAGPRQPALSPHAPQLRSPVLVLQGDRDTQSPLRSAREFVRRQSCARLEVLPDVGHDPMRDAPVQTWRLIEAFLTLADDSSAASADTQYSCLS
jgi:pimeloyl-ACP methyl ester carboxylesterase